MNITMDTNTLDAIKFISVTFLSWWFISRLYIMINK